MKYWNKLTLVSKIAFILWTLDALYMLLSGESDVNFMQWIIIWLFGYVIFVGIAQFFSTRKKKSSTIEMAQIQLQRANELANIANKTTDRCEFYRSINEIKSILKELSKYEGKLPFIGSPSSDLRNLERIKQSQIELLEKRIEEKEKNTTKEKPNLYTPETELIEHNNIYIDNNFITQHYFDRVGKEYDALLLDAGKIVVDKEKASIGMLQREFKIGFNRAYRIMEQLYECGVIGEESGTSPRKVLMNSAEYEVFKSQFNGILTDYYDRTEVANMYNSGLNNSERIKMYNDKFDYMVGHDFEYYCAKILEKNGFNNVEVTPGSGDNGIDIIAYKDGVKYGVQCKCYSSDIGIKAIQEVFAGAKYYDCHVPAVLTNRYFTRQAKELAEKTNVLLWDRDKLIELINTSD